jgi:uncharacterized protein YwgA
MREREDVVVAVVAAAPEARLTSRVRLQKTVYLLDRLGFESGFDFDYHHYGPYSRELDNATSDAKALKLIEERTEHRIRDGAGYSIFKSKSAAKPELYAKAGRQQVRDWIGLFARTNVTVLELAATIDWLLHEEKVPNWRSEIVARKGAKTSGGRLEKAIELLTSLGLAPPQPDTETVP